MEQISSIESRTRASFARVKRDIDALKSQVSKLRARDEALDHALSDYARTGELYERIKQVDDRFAQLSDTFVTAAEFEKGIARLVKEMAQITKRLATLEKSDAEVEIAAMRKEIESLSRRSLEKKTFDEFVDRATHRIEKLDTSFEKLDERSRALDTLEKRFSALEKIEVEAKRIAEHEKMLKKLEGLDQKTIEKRFSALESDKLTQAAIKAIVASELENAVRVDELNEKIDEFNAALDSAAERARVDELESKIALLEKRPADTSALKDLEKQLSDRLGALEKQLSSESQKTSKELVSSSDELDVLSSRLSQFESLLGEMRASLDEELVSVDEFNEKIDEFNTALGSAADRTRFETLESDVSKLLERIDSVEKSGLDKDISKRLDSERHATNAQITTAIEQIDEITARVDELSDRISQSKDAKLSEGRLDVLSARVDELETSSDSDLAERISDVEAQLKVVIDDMGDAHGSVNERVIENMARDIGKMQSRIEEVSEELEMLSSSSKKGAQRVESVEHLQSEIEFLRTNVAMQADIESLRTDLEKAPKGKEGKDNRVSILADDLQRLIERQSELEKKVLSLETQSKRAPKDPLWDEKNVEISEKVPLREPKRSTPKKAAEKEKAPEPAPVEESSDDDPGALGKVRRWMVDFFTEEVDEKKEPKKKDELY